MIQAVIFDMDGLLIDSEPLWQEAEISVFTKLGVPLTLEMTSQTMGLRTDEVVAYWYHRYPWDGVELAAVVKQIDSMVLRLIKDKAIAKPGVHEVMELCESLGLPIALASSSSMVLINAVVKKINIDQKLHILHSAEFEEYGKPHPGVYITAAKKLGFVPSHCLAFEDSANGVLSAKAAKMHCIAIPEPEARQDKRFGIADAVVGSLSEVTKEMLTSF